MSGHLLSARLTEEWPCPQLHPRGFTTCHQGLEIQTGCEQEEELLLAKWGPGSGDDSHKQ